VHPHRQRFKLGAKALEGTDVALSAQGVANGAQLEFKDLGPQIGYRTVFVWEYAGPIFIVLAYAFARAVFYGADAVTGAAADLHPNAVLGVQCWVAHFAKREFETLFVHRFSRPTMPLFNLFKNSIYYWSFALLVGYPLCHPDYTPAPASHVQLGFAIFVVSELLNFAVHVSLRTMRPAEGSKERPIPTGLLFSLVSCPNYTFEVMGWVGFSLMTHIFWSYAFTLVGFLQMWAWAKKKHVGYLKVSFFLCCASRSHACPHTHHFARVADTPSRPHPPLARVRVRHVCVRISDAKTYGDAYKKLGRKPIIPFLC
jgi:very-long-chain enoyl-CoA reductase